MRKTVGSAMTYAILRDLTYRLSFFQIFAKMNQKFLEGTKFDHSTKVNNMFLSVIAATLISHPFEVVFTKIASQRQLKYTNIFKTPLEIIREEGIGKITIGGLWPRICYNLLSTSIMFNCYDSLLEASL
jgi:hypothetical protein